MENIKLFEQLKKKKESTVYGIKTISEKVMDVDLSKRSVEGLLNTYFYIDHDFDMLVTGAAKRSIQHSGPKSTATAKIKHLADHVMRTDHVVGLFTELEEKEIDGLERIWFISELPETTKGNDHLINYQSGLYDNHSIGFRYVKYIVCNKDSENEDQVKNWDEWYPQAINKEKADEHGFFFVVKEIELWEGSVVMFGSNELTPTLGVKSKDKNIQLVELTGRLDGLTKALRAGSQSDDEMKMIELSEKQIKQMMYNIVNEDPFEKSTPLDSPASDTLDYGKIISNIQINI